MKRRKLPRASSCPCGGEVDEHAEQSCGSFSVIVGCTSCTVCVGASGATKAIAARAAFDQWEAYASPNSKR